MAAVVQFMAEIGIIHPPFITGPGMRVNGINGAVCIEVAIGFLGQSDKSDQRIKTSLQNGIRNGLQGIAGRFDELVDIGVIKRIFRTEFSLHQLAGNLEIVYPARVITFTDGNGDCNLEICLDFRGPEFIRKFYRSERHGFYRIGPCWLFRSTGHQQTYCQHPYRGFFEPFSFHKFEISFVVLFSYRA